VEKEENKITGISGNNEMMDSMSINEAFKVRKGSMPNDKVAKDH